MKKAKKILSVIMSVIMIFSFTFVAFATDGEKGEINKTYTAELKREESKTLTFTADRDGFYYVDAYVLDDLSAFITISAANDEVTEIAGNYGFTDKPCVILNKNDVFTVEVYNGHVDDIDITVEFTVKGTDLVSLSEGENTIESDYAYFAFTPEKDGLYNFRSSDIGEFDPRIFIFENGQQVGYNDDIGYDYDANFDLTVPLEAGKTYLINTRQNGDGEFKPYTVTVSYNKKILAEEVYFPMLEREDDLVFYSKGYYGSNFFVTPFGAAYSDEITVTVGNEKILNAEIQNGTSLRIITLRPGKTTLTFTTESGIQKTFTIKVQPQFIRVLLNWINSIRNFFSRIFNF